MSSIAPRAAHAVRVVAFLTAMMLLAGCGSSLPTYRYVLTVEVETPEGLRTGSSVIEVRSYRSVPWQPGGGSSKARGEAVAVDLGKRGILFALLSSRAHDQWVYASAVAPVSLDPGSTGTGATFENWPDRLRALKSVRGRANVPVSHYPMLVRFRDIRDSRTVEEVQPNDLSGAFGAGVRLVRISAEITSEPTSWTLREVLPWLSEFPEPRLDPDFRSGVNPSLSQRLSHGDFVREH